MYQKCWGPWNTKSSRNDWKSKRQYTALTAYRYLSSPEIAKYRPAWSATGTQALWTTKVKKPRDTLLIWKGTAVRESSDTTPLLSLPLQAWWCGQLLEYHQNSERTVWFFIGECTLVELSQDNIAFSQQSNLTSTNTSNLCSHTSTKSLFSLMHYLNEENRSGQYSQSNTWPTGIWSQPGCQVSLDELRCLWTQDHCTMKLMQKLHLHVFSVWIIKPGGTAVLRKSKSSSKKLSCRLKSESDQLQPNCS